MCGRATLIKKKSKIEKRFAAKFQSNDLETYDFEPSYNIAPTQLHPVITGADSDHLQFFKWGLIPSWAKDKSIGSKMINARKETLSEKPSFRNALKKRRCIIPFDGFYEWKKTSNGLIPHYIFCTNQELFSMAGLWETWKDENGEPVHSFTIITMAANKFMAPLHHRMPAILLPGNENTWIDPELTAEEATQVLLPYPAELMNSYSVSREVNKVKNNHPGLIIEEKYPPSLKQGNLFGD
ncbi:MAG: SOS response-associated peptidase [Saprospiraceae bacterium]